MSYQMIFLIIITVLLAIGLVIYAVKYFKTKTLDEVRKDVYQLFLRAEKKWTESGQGEQKMKWVVQKARALLPNWLQAIISEQILTKIIQFWFDGVKDLLDDGKVNKSVDKGGD